MYDWILANLVNRELGYGDILRESDVMIISSDKERSSFLNQYRDNPEILMEKKIILITHVRFWTDLINYFLIYRPQVPVDSFDGDFRKLMVRPDLRRYILFDETPTFIRPFVEFDRTILGYSVKPMIRAISFVCHRKKSGFITTISSGIPGMIFSTSLTELTVLSAM